MWGYFADKARKITPQIHLYFCIPDEVIYFIDPAIFRAAALLPGPLRA